jgi:hypothetical protein
MADIYLGFGDDDRPVHHTKPVHSNVNLDYGTSHVGARPPLVGVEVLGVDRLSVDGRELVIRAIVGGRQSGKTTAALKWLMQGHIVAEWPCWSRGLVVAAEDRIPYAKNLLKALWEEEGRWPAKPPFEAVIPAYSLFSSNYSRGWTHSFYERALVLDEFDYSTYPQADLYEEVFSRFNVELTTRTGYPLCAGEITPSEFMDLLDSTATEETP